MKVLDRETVKDIYLMQVVVQDKGKNVFIGFGWQFSPPRRWKENKKKEWVKKKSGPNSAVPFSSHVLVTRYLAKFTGLLESDMATPWLLLLQPQICNLWPVNHMHHWPHHPSAITNSEVMPMDLHGTLINEYGSKGEDTHAKAAGKFRLLRWSQPQEGGTGWGRERCGPHQVIKTLKVACQPKYLPTPALVHFLPE